MSLINTTQMVIPPVGVVAVLKLDGTQLFCSVRPLFSFEYGALRFLNSVQEFQLGAEVIQMTNRQIAEVDAYLETVQENLPLSRQVLQNKTSREQLAATDWYVTRFVETGVPIPPDITTARQLARTLIHEL